MPPVREHGATRRLEPLNDEGDGRGLVAAFAVIFEGLHQDPVEFALDEGAEALRLGTARSSWVENGVLPVSSS